MDKSTNKGTKTYLDNESKARAPSLIGYDSMRSVKYDYPVARMNNE